jgi:hypothetical protein
MHLLMRDSIPESVLAMRTVNVTLAALLLTARDSGDDSRRPPAPPPHSGVRAT